MCAPGSVFIDPAAGVLIAAGVAAPEPGRGTARTPCARPLLRVMEFRLLERLGPVDKPVLLAGVAMGVRVPEDGGVGREAFSRWRLLIGNFVLREREDGNSVYVYEYWLWRLENREDKERNLPASRANGNRLTENCGRVGDIVFKKEVKEDDRVDVLDRHTEQTKPMSTMFL